MSGIRALKITVWSDPRHQERLGGVCCDGATSQELHPEGGAVSPIPLNVEMKSSEINLLLMFGSNKRFTSEWEFKFESEAFRRKIFHLMSFLFFQTTSYFPTKEQVEFFRNICRIVIKTLLINELNYVFSSNYIIYNYIYISVRRKKLIYYAIYNICY